MDINSVNSAATKTNTATQKDNNQVDKEMFLKLLVAQLKHQDPMSPVDNNDFLNQSVQFSTLESMQNLTRDFADMKLMQYLGKNITFSQSNSTVTHSGVVDSIVISEGKKMLKVGDDFVDIKNIKRVDAIE